MLKSIIRQDDSIQNSTEATPATGGALDPALESLLSNLDRDEIITSDSSDYAANSSAMWCQ